MAIIVRDLRGHFTFVTLALATLFVFSFFQQGMPAAHLQVAAVTETDPGEATDKCVALSKTSTVAGHPRQVGEYCLVTAALGSDKLACTADDTIPPGVCKVHYCDQSGCHDTSTSIPTEILNIEKGAGEVGPNSGFDTSGIQTSPDLQNNSFNTDVSGYSQTPTPSTVSPGTEGVGADQIGAINNSPNSESVLFSPDAQAPTPQQFSSDSSIYQNVPASTDVTSANAESTTLAPNSVNVDGPSAESTFSAPNTESAAAQTEAKPSFFESATDKVNVYIDDVKSYFGLPVGPANPCPSGTCVTVGIRG